MRLGETIFTRNAKSEGKEHTTKEKTLKSQMKISQSPVLKPNLLPVSLLAPVGIEVAIISTLWVPEMTLRSSLLMMRILLRSNTTTDPSTSDTTTKPVRTIVSLTLRSTLTTLSRALALGLTLTRPTLHRSSTTTANTNSTVLLVFVSSFGRICVARSGASPSYTATRTARLSTKAHESLTSTSVELFAVVCRTDAYISLTEAKSMRVLVLRVVWVLLVVIVTTLLTIQSLAVGVTLGLNTNTDISAGLLGSRTRCRVRPRWARLEHGRVLDIGLGNIARTVGSAVVLVLRVGIIVVRDGGRWELLWALTAS